MRDERLGSYSIETTVPGTPVLSRLKSMARSLRLCPPPRCQTVMSPELRRPPVRGLISVSALCGLLAWMSSFTIVVMNLRDGVIGLYGFFHFGVGRLGGDFEHQRAFGLFYAQALFRNHRAADDLIRGLHYATSALRFGALAFSESCNFSSAGRENTAVSKRSR